MELTQPAILTLIDYLYTGCIQASSNIWVNIYESMYDVPYVQIEFSNISLQG